MARPPCRITQLSCVVVVVLGLLPWGLTLAAVLIYAIESQIPLPMAIAAWIVMLVPLWIVWFGSLAWTKRNESAVPAVLMAVPSVIVTALFMMLPVAASLP